MAGEEGEDNNSFPAIASHVTSYARMVIWKAIKYCQKNNIKYYYCDTDSIFIDGELPAEMVDDSELGKFKVEKVFPYGVEFINLKNYCELNENGKKVVQNDKGEKIEIDENTFINKESKIIKGKGWKMKGVSADAELIDENRFIQQEWGGLPKQEYYTKFGRKPGEFWIIYKEKTNHGDIKKGQLKGNDIVPYELEVI
jgi:DNA polymerase elongation subunit (family B)